MQGKIGVNLDIKKTEKSKLALIKQKRKERENRE